MLRAWLALGVVASAAPLWEDLPCHRARALTCEQSGATAFLDEVAQRPLSSAVVVELGDLGVGNALNPIMGAFLYAAVSGRALAVDAPSTARLSPHFAPSDLAVRWGAWAPRPAPRDCSLVNATRTRELECVMRQPSSAAVRVWGHASFVQSQGGEPALFGPLREMLERRGAPADENLLLDCARARLFTPSGQIRDALAPYLSELDGRIVVGAHFRSTDTEMAAYQGLDEELRRIKEATQNRASAKHARRPPLAAAPPSGLAAGAGRGAPPRPPGGSQTSSGRGRSEQPRRTVRVRTAARSHARASTAIANWAS